ncbi:MAG: chromosomal replication initiator protein DnaA [Planctomycetota bacterium]|jgi:chromosomal replication initiator protein
MSDASPTNVTWEKVAAILRRSVPRQQFETWFRGMRLAAVYPDHALFTVPNNFLREWILRKYTGVLRNAVREVLGRDVELDVRIADDGDPVQSPTSSQSGSITGSPAVEAASAGGPAGIAPSLPAPAAPRAPFGGPRPAPSTPYGESDIVLNPQYVFENFVPGPSNNFALAAALAVAESPGKTYNPLFLHGSVGLGKTHLLQGVCHRMMERRPDMRILYLSCETFVNHFVNAVANGELDSFRFRYRHVDVLLIDDIHFLAHRERTQEEFFHTFNTLYNANKQIILSSDSTPAEIPTLEERLVSRFKWGVVGRIDAPHYETRIAIIARKVRMHGMDFPEAVVKFVGENVRSNIRELEGAVNKLVSMSHLTSQPIDVDMAREALRDLVPPTTTRVSVDGIMRCVADRFGLSVRDITGKRRHRHVARARHVSMYLARRLTSHSLEEIGGYMGGRDHTTVMHGFQRIRNDIQEDPELAQVLDNLINELSR